MKPLPLTDVQLFEITKMIKNGRIRVESVDMAKATRFILQTTEAMAELNSMKVAHMKYDAAYNAGHDVGEALFAAYGYRPGGGEGQHVALGQFMTIIFDQSAAAQAAIDFDSIRQARNALRYRANPISSIEADFAAEVANLLLIQATVILPMTR
jgi:hypothetical protein